MVTEANKHWKMLPSVVSCLLLYNHMTWNGYDPPIKASVHQPTSARFSAHFHVWCL